MSEAPNAAPHPCPYSEPLVLVAAVGAFIVTLKEYVPAGSSKESGPVERTFGLLPSGRPSSVIEYALEDSAGSVAIELGGTVTFHMTSVPIVFQSDFTAPYGES